MKRCLIVGAGDAGAEILSWALQMKQDEWQIGGFLDSDPNALKDRDLPYQVIGDPATWEPTGNDVLVAAIGDPADRLRVCEDLASRGAKFITVIHPSVIMALNVTIGEGCVICPYVVISANAKLGRFVFVNISASVGHDTVTGNGTTISCHCDIMGHVSLGERCFLGSHAAILPGKRVGDGAIIGAGSAVVRNVRSGQTVMGVPAEALFNAE